MRIINLPVILILVCFLKNNVETVVIKGSLPEINDNLQSTETTRNLEAKYILVEKESQNTSLSNALKEKLLSKESVQSKRCARTEILGSALNSPTLSIARRDLTEKRIQQCEFCKKGKLCKNHNICLHCKTVCNGIPTTTSAESYADNGDQSLLPEEKKEVKNLPTDNENNVNQHTLVETRFKEDSSFTTIQIPQDYLLGSAPTRPPKGLFRKIFHKDSFVKKGATPLPSNANNNKIFSSRSEDKKENLSRDIGNAEDNANQNIMVGIRFQDDNSDTVQMPRYYSLGSVDRGPIKSLFGKIFNVPESFEKFIVLGKIKGKDEDKIVDDIIIIDLAQVFGTNKKSKVKLHKFESSEIPSVNLVNDINEKLDKAVNEKMKKTGETHLSTNEINDIIEKTMKEPTSNVGAPQVETEAATRCSVDEAVEDLIDIMPSGSSGYSRDVPYAKQKPVVEPNNIIVDDEPAEPIVPSNINEYSRNTPHTKQQPFVQPENLNAEDETVKQIKNPNVIQDSLKMLGKSSDDENIMDPNKDEKKENAFLNYIEDKPQEINNLKTHKDQSNIQEVVKEISPEEDDPVNNVMVESRNSDLESVSQNLNPPAEDQKLESPVQELPPPKETLLDQSQSKSNDLEQSVINIVQDSLKAIPDNPDLLQEPTYKENIIEEQLQDSLNQTPSKIIEKNFDPSQTSYIDVAKPVSNTLQDKMQEPLLAAINPLTSSVSSNTDSIPKNDINLPSQQSEIPTITKKPTPELKSRSEFLNNQHPQEGINYFGALVPAKDIPVDITDPRIKKVYYVGDNINLPLKMFQDQNGVMKLRVDTDALCNCKNTNCTKEHIDNEFTATMRNEENTREALPELQLRFSSDGSKAEDLTDDFIDTLHNNNDNLGIFKRSPNVDAIYSDETFTDKDYDVSNNDDKIPNKNLQFEKMDLENEIEKLNKNIEKYNNANKDLINKGTIALLKDFEKTRNANQMIVLANNLFSWMKDFTLKQLDS